MTFDTSKEYACSLDAADELKVIRNEFVIPERNGVQQTYFLGNSLGLQPKISRAHIDMILQDWGDYGVEAFFEAKEPWMFYHDKFLQPLGEIVGAKPAEVVVMNQLTVNLHLLLTTFYRPDGNRLKIICEAGAFPSDQYALETHIKSRGLRPEDVLIEIQPEKNGLLSTDKILDMIATVGNELALVIMGGINYYTGQLLNMERITAAAHVVGAYAGFDLAHAAGNVSLQLHNWKVDFAVWCSYKYLNGGPGAVAGAFINEVHHGQKHIRLAGWWGYERKNRFLMQPGFVADEGASGWQLSTPSMLLYACMRGALETIEKAGWGKMQQKQIQLNAYTWNWIDYILAGSPSAFTVLTPQQKEERGAQLSLAVKNNGKALYKELLTRNIIVDWREPNVIRFAAVPLYNTYEDVWRLGSTLKELVELS